MKEEVKGPVIIYCDNTSAIIISKNLVSHPKSKHIGIKYMYLKEHVEEKEVRLEYINTTKQIVDIFTKPLPKESFEYFKGKLGVLSLSEIH